jgi:hypothetical protein
MIGRILLAILIFFVVATFAKSIIIGMLAAMFYLMVM